MLNENGSKQRTLWVQMWCATSPKNNAQFSDKTTDFSCGPFQCTLIKTGTTMVSPSILVRNLRHRPKHCVAKFSVYYCANERLNEGNCVINGRQYKAVRCEQIENTPRRINLMIRNQSIKEINTHQTKNRSPLLISSKKPDFCRLTYVQNAIFMWIISKSRYRNLAI